LINDAKSYHYHKEKLNDLELLLELQHYGAATGLVDFSRDFLIVENLSLSSCKIGFFSSCKILIVFALSIV
jgi:hypothetical protein